VLSDSDRQAQGTANYLRFYVFVGRVSMQNDAKSAMPTESGKIGYWVFSLLLL